MSQAMDIMLQYCPKYTTPDSFRLARAPISKNVTTLEVTRKYVLLLPLIFILIFFMFLLIIFYSPTWDLSVHTKAKQVLVTTLISFTWANEIYTIVKDGEEQGGISNSMR